MKNKEKVNLFNKIFKEIKKFLLEEHSLKEIY